MPYGVIIEFYQPVSETKAGPSVQDQQLLVRTSNFSIFLYKSTFKFFKILIRAGNFFSLVLNTVVDVGSGNGLLPEDTKSIPEPMLTNLQWGLVAFTQGQFHWKCSIYLTLIWVRNYWFNIAATPSRGQWAKVDQSRAYHQISNIRYTQSPNINVSRVVLQLSLPNPLKPGVKLRMKI